MSAMVRRRRDGHVAFDLDVVHAGVVAEALEQTRAVLSDDPGGPGGSPPATPDEDPHLDEFDAIVQRLGGESPVPDDPVLRRLLPDSSLDDPEQAAEFRRLAGSGVRDAKVAAIDSVLEDLALLRRQDGGVVVAPERAQAWLTALNDCRLALGTLLAVGEDDDLHAELDAYEAELVAEAVGGPDGPDAPDEPDDGAGAEGTERALRAYRIAVYDFLSALLEMVVRAVDR
jgi:hypothetical protein